MEKNLRRRFAILTVSIFAAQIVIANYTHVELTKIKRDLDEIIKGVDNTAHIGIKIQSLKSKESLYEKNSKKLFTPASAVKLFTATLALSLLGKDWAFKTQVFTDGYINKGCVYGNLYLKGSGDPSFSIDDLKDLVKQLYTKGIRSITGNLIIDTTEFDELYFGPGWSWDDGTALFHSPISSLNINHNSLKLNITASAPTKNIPTIAIYPETKYMILNNQAIVTEPDIATYLSIKRRWVTQENIVDIKGTFARNTERAYEVTVERPECYSAALFKELLQAQGIIMQGYIVKRTTPRSALIIATHSSIPMQQIVEHMLKESDNLFAECLLKKIGAVYIGIPGSWVNGQSVLLEFIRKNIKIDPNEFCIVDGSGYSRYNLLSPEQYICLLSWICDRPELYSVILESLPTAGFDGTLKNRMTDSAAYLKVKAKTGTMRGISALGGFTVTKDNEPLAFAIFINGVVKPIEEYKLRIEDKICSYLTQFSRISSI